MDNLLSHMQKFDLPVSVVEAKEAKDKCPYLTVPDNLVGIFEEDAGILTTSKCVNALQVKSYTFKYQIVTNFSRSVMVTCIRLKGLCGTK